MPVVHTILVHLQPSTLSNASVMGKLKADTEALLKAIPGADTVFVGPRLGRHGGRAFNFCVSLTFASDVQAAVDCTPKGAASRSPLMARLRGGVLRPYLDDAEDAECMVEFSVSEAHGTAAGSSVMATSLSALESLAVAAFVGAGVAKLVSRL